MQVQVQGAYTDAEKLALSRILMSGPAWNNKTGQPATAVLQW